MHPMSSFRHVNYIPNVLVPSRYAELAEMYIGITELTVKYLHYTFEDSHKLLGYLGSS